MTNSETIPAVPCFRLKMKPRLQLFAFLLMLLLCPAINAFPVVGHRNKVRLLPVFATTTKDRQKEKVTSKTDASNIEATSEKYGLEAGLFQSLKNNDGGESAKALLKKYGIAYLATTIPLALVSFGLCFFLVESGVDTSAILSKLGIGSGVATETAGTFAIAYAAHKAASPLRFPLTVILTPVVAKIIGKEPEVDEPAI